MLLLVVGNRYSVTSIRSQDADLAVIAQHQFVRFRLDGRTGQADTAADETILDAGRDVTDQAMLQNNSPLDLAILNHDVVVDRGERADVGVDDAGALADDGRAPDHTVDNLRPFWTMTRLSTSESWFT